MLALLLLPEEVGILAITDEGNPLLKAFFTAQ